MDKLEANHFVDMKEARLTPGSYRVLYAQNGMPETLLAHCPCGCGALKQIVLFPFNGNKVKGWVLSGEHGHHNLYPAVSFFRGWASPLPHWDGWLLDGHWIRNKSPELKLAAPTVTVVDPQSSSGEVALESA